MLLMNLKFTTKVARVITEGKYNEKKAFPLPNDVKKLSTLIATEMDSLDYNDHSYCNYSKAVRSVVTKLKTYNHMRCGEVQAMQ